MDNTPQVDPDAYYGDEDVSSSELDLSFLDEDESEKSEGNASEGAAQDDNEST